jgi:tRNA dimethylallyltransferase
VNLQTEHRPVVAVVGPTASGKTALGVALALRFGGEIVNCDSVQVYRGIEIATAKPTAEERRGVAHHLIDFVPPEASFTAGEWARAAAEAVRGIEARARLALLVGGTGFYLRALRQPLFESPPTDERLRQRLVRLRERRGAEHLHRMLARLDAATADRLSPRDWSRVQRALEVYFQTGAPLSRLRDARPPAPEFAPRIRVFALRPPREELYRRIDARADAHFRAGLVEEVRALLAAGVPAEKSALGSHGYRRVVEHLRGQRTLESAVGQTKLDVRHYAKRQLTWFRREEGVEWLDGFGDDAAVQRRLAERLEEILRARPEG